MFDQEGVMRLLTRILRDSAREYINAIIYLSTHDEPTYTKETKEAYAKWRTEYGRYNKALKDLNNGWEFYHSDWFKQISLGADPDEVIKGLHKIAQKEGGYESNGTMLGKYGQAIPTKDNSRDV